MLDLSTRGLREDGGNCLKYLNPIQDGHFRGCSRWGEGVGQKSVTYPTMMKLGTVIPYLKKIQKIYESRDTPLTSTDISFFHQKPANFNISRNTDTDCILVIISNSFSFS